MIKEIKLENWKSFKNLTFKPQSMNIIIGANASGKSNFLEALELLQKKARGISDDEIEKIRGGKSMFHKFEEENFKITAEFEMDSQEMKYEIFNKKDILIENKKFYENNKLKEVQKKAIQVMEKTKNFSKNFEKTKIDIEELSKLYQINNLDIIKKEDINSKKIKSLKKVMLETKKRFDEFLQLNTEIKTAEKEVKEFKEKINLIEEKNLDILKNITILDPIPREIRGQSVITADKYILKDCSNIIPIIASLPFEKKQELENRLKEYLNELLDYEIMNINFSKAGNVGEYNQLYLEEKIGGKIQKLFSNIISDGTLRFIAIISALLIQPKGTIFAIEELDNGIAPAKTKTLMKIIDEISLEREVDVIFTTHNTILMNYLDEELLDFIFFTYRGKDGNSKIVRIKDLNRFPKLLSYGPIGDLMATNKILDFIEGEENE